MSVFRNKNITNLVDYVFGVEVGLDTNARKNRGGENMAKAVALKFKSANVPFRSEVNSTEFREIKSLGQDLKRFDFVIQTKKKTYLIETIKQLLAECTDIELLYLIQGLLSGQN